MFRGVWIRVVVPVVVAALVAVNCGDVPESEFETASEAGLFFGSGGIFSGSGCPVSEEPVDPGPDAEKKLSACRGEEPDVGSGSGWGWRPDRLTRGCQHQCYDMLVPRCSGFTMMAVCLTCTTVCLRWLPFL